MPICIECQHPVQTLWTHYETAPVSTSLTSGPGAAPGEGGNVSSSRDSGHNIRLTVCRNCGRFCDKYVEHDFVVLFIDLVLIKPQVYRHLLHNTLVREKGQYDPSIIRLAILLLLFDVYLTWARIEKRVTSFSSSISATADDINAHHEPSHSRLGMLANEPIGFQYMFFLILCILTTGAFHLSIRTLICSPYSPLVWLPQYLGTAPFFPATPLSWGRQLPGNANVVPEAAGHYSGDNSNGSRSNSTGYREDGSRTKSSATPQAEPYRNAAAISTALIVSSTTKLLPILMIIWDYDVSHAARSLGWAVVANNIESLKILLGCRYLVAGILGAAGAAARWLTAYAVLWCVGMEGKETVAVVGGGMGDGNGVGNYLVVAATALAWEGARWLLGACEGEGEEMGERGEAGQRKWWTLSERLWG